MKKLILRCTALLLALCLVLPAPAQAEGLLSLFSQLLPDSGEDVFTVTAYSDMEYTRPDLEQLQARLDEATRLAQGEDADAILDGVFDFYDAYDWFFTASALANIRYSMDLSDKYWEAEYHFCSSATPTVQQMLDSLYTALAASPCRRKLEWKFFGYGYFDSYQEDTLLDDTLVALMERENQLISQYYAQSSRFTTLLGRLFPQFEEVAQTLVDLIQVRNEMAAYAGYDSYESFAKDSYYYRDYTPEEMTAYLDGIQEKLVPLYPAAQRELENTNEATPEQTMDYLRTAAKAMGGTVGDAFQLMEEAGLYHIDAGAHKYDSCFELYLPSYQEPFLFMNPAGMEYDCLTLAHEFGHFCNDYASFGTVVGIDVREIFSQGLEYLSLVYHPEAQALTRYKIADSLSTFVEQACYARFEQRMYQLSEPTAQALRELYETTAAEFGMADEYFSCWDFVTVPHFYTNPMYISSYIISNDAALQLYQLECRQSGEGLALYQQSLDTQQPYFLAFLEEAGLESPFAPGRLDETAEFFRTQFKGHL